MNNEIAEVVIIPENENALVQVIQDSGVEQTTATRIKEAFLTMFSDAEQWAEMAKTISVTDVTQVREMKLARETRLALREIRIKAENARKTLKADALATGKAIDGIANVLKALVVPLETRLQEQEDFAKLYEADQARQLHEKRFLILERFSDVIELTQMDLAAMPEEQFDAMIDGLNAERAKIQHEAEEAERIEREAEEAAKQKAIEAEKLRQAELAEAKAQADKERAARIKAEKIAAAERAEREKEREAAQRKANAEAARIEAEIKKVAAQAARDAETQKQRALAPDREKLAVFAAEVRSLDGYVPKLASRNGDDANKKIKEQIEKFAAWIENIHLLEANTDMKVFKP